MTIDWFHFTPLASLAGGLLLGLAAAMFILFNGRILVVSGILRGLLTPRSGDVAWRVAFILGMAVAPMLGALIFPESIKAALAVPRIDSNVPTIVSAGLLVGFGTRYGSGCTSGHGVCGLSRLSPRSLMSTLTFMGVGFAVVAIARHLF